MEMWRANFVVNLQPGAYFTVQVFSPSLTLKDEKTKGTTLNIKGEDLLRIPGLTPCFITKAGDRPTGGAAARSLQINATNEIAISTLRLTD